MQVRADLSTIYDCVVDCATQLRHAAQLSEKEVVHIRDVISGAMTTVSAQKDKIDWDGCVSYMLLIVLLEATLTKAKITKATIDKLLTNIFTKLVVTKSVNQHYAYVDILQAAIFYKYYELANLLLDEKLCDFTKAPPRKLSCLMHAVRMTDFDRVVFEKLLAQDNVNYAISLRNDVVGYIHKNNTYAFIKILEHPAYTISDYNIGLILSNDNKLVTNALRARLQKLVVKPEQCENLLPVAFLSEEANQVVFSMVKSRIETEPLLKAYPDLKAELMAFLHSEVPLPFKYMNRLSVVHDLLVILNKPEQIDQYDTLLCAMVALMQHCVMNNPAALIRHALSICEDPKINRKFGTHAFHITQLWQEVVRHQYNTVLGHRSSSPLANITAVTRPDQLCKMYKDFGFNVISETFQIQFENKLAGRLWEHSAHRKASSNSSIKIYSEGHSHIADHRDRFNQLCEIAKEATYITILVNKHFLAQFFYEMSLPGGSMLLVEQTHYMIIQNFSYDDQKETVNFEFMTWGHKLQIKGMPLKIFASGFRGAMAMTTNPQLELGNENRSSLELMHIKPKRK